MELVRDFESFNARDWDEDSTVELSAQPTSTNKHARGQPGLVASLGQQSRAGHQRENGAGISYGSSGTIRASGHVGQSRDRLNSLQNTISNVGKFNLNPTEREQRGFKHIPGHYRRHAGLVAQISVQSTKAKANRWPRGSKLVTTRMSSLNDEKEREKVQSDKYLHPVERETDYPSTAYYLWPKQDTNPRELLGWKLEKLDILRKTHKVLIEWDDKKQCFIINSERATSDHDLMIAIRGIRQVVRSLEAEVAYASPHYVVNPPAANSMRTKVQPKYDFKKKIIGVELTGRRFSTLEQDLWSSNHEEMTEKNLTRVQDHLRKHTALLAPLMGWMRMRVHFGHATLGKVREDFIQSKYSLAEFAQMMDMSRVRTSGKFDRKLDDAALAAEILRTIVRSPEYFCPVKARVSSLEDIQPKHTGIIFVNIPDGENLRIEADVDYILEDGQGQYQMGSTRLYRDDRRNKRVEITTLDTESEFDWTLEIITDGSVGDLPDQLLWLIEGSLSRTTEGRKDCLGLSYPRVAPKNTPGIDVRAVVVRSVYQYLLKDSGYIIEIAVYREWGGYSTTGEPKILSSVSMFHPVWDDQMSSIENTTGERKWDTELSCFFGDDQTGGGIRKFMEDVAFIQGLLSGPARRKEPLSVLCSYDGMGHVAEEA